ncbi:MAG: TonB-dependent receptor plug domain-containing protein [Chitinispirillaceae bacterium]|nr:TonB-dependent receptor plug domain-containing protein [Chitinispirillaceae bacterium]
MNSVTKGVWATFFFLTVLLGTQDRVAAQSVVPQTRLLTGKVVDKKTGLPIPEAAVSVTAMNPVVRGNPEGKFKIDIPAAIACTLTVEKTGYEQSSLPINPDAENKFVEITLEPLSLSELEKMTVFARRNSLKSNENISRITISPELATKLPAVGQADLFRSLQLLPGVSGTNESSSALYVRGGTPDQNLILLDNIPIYYVNHLYGFYSAFNPYAIDEVSIHKGGFGPQWGGRLSGVVEMSSSGGNKPYDPEGMGIKTGIGTGFLSSDGFLQIPVKNHDIGTVMIAGRRSMTDFFPTDLFGRIFDRMHGSDTMTTSGSGDFFGGRSITSHIVYRPEVLFWDLNGLATFRLGSRGRLATTLFASRDYQDNSFDSSWLAGYYLNVKTTSVTPEGVPVLQFDTVTTTTSIKDNAPVYWGNRCIGQKWEQQWSEAYISNLNLSYSEFTDKKREEYLRTETRTHRYSDTTSPTDTVIGNSSWMASTNKIIDISGRLDNTFKPADWNTLKTGVEISQKTVIYERDTLQPDTTTVEWRSTPPSLRQRYQPIHSHDTGISMAVYAGDEMGFGDKAGLTLGARLYYFKPASSWAIDPRISGWWKLFPEVKVKGAWGMYTQEIHRAEQEDIMGGSKFVWLLANENRPLEKSQHFIGGVSWEKTHFLLDVEAYYKRLSGLLTISEQLPLEWLPQYAFNPNDLALYEGTGTAKGIELLAQVKDVSTPLFSRELTYDGWAAYTWSKVENTYAVFNLGNPFPATQDRTHEIKLINNLEWDVATWSSIALGAVWLYSTGTPYTAPLGTYRLQVIGGNPTPVFQYVSDKNTYRLPDYHRLDLSATWKVHFGKHVQGSLILGLFNAYNNELVLERSYTAETIGGYGPIQATVYTPIHKISMPITFNPALRVSAQF